MVFPLLTLYLQYIRSAWALCQAATVIRVKWGAHPTCRASVKQCQTCLTERSASAGSGNATIDNSTVFLDFLGPLGGSTVATWTNTSANAAVKSGMASVQSAVRKGFMARVAADWQVTHR